MQIHVSKISTHNTSSYSAKDVAQGLNLNIMHRQGYDLTFFYTRSMDADLRARATHTSFPLSVDQRLITRGLLLLFDSCQTWKRYLSKGDRKIRLNCRAETLWRSPSIVDHCHVFRLDEFRIQHILWMLATGGLTAIGWVKSTREKEKSGTILTKQPYVWRSQFHCVLCVRVCIHLYVCVFYRM